MQYWQSQQVTKRSSAFTLVELVVVITILAILGTIGFLSVGGYSSRARDSDRLADVANLSKSLDLSIVTTGSYPTPDNSFSVAYSGGVVWYQGTVSNGVIQQLHTSISGGGMSKKPVDPLDGTEYSYSTLAFGKAYQIATDYENDGSLTAYVDTAYAAPGAPSIAYVRGNYGGLVAKTTTGSITYVIAAPSILTNSGVTAGSTVELKSNSLSGTLLFNGKNLKWASSYNPVSLVYSGASLPKDDTSGQITAMVTVLRAAYAGTDISSNSAVATLLNTSTGSLGTFGTSILTAQLGGTASTGGDNGTTYSGACTNLPSNSVYFNGSTSYSVNSASTLSAATAGYRASPTTNTCQWTCNTASVYNGSVCQAYVSATETDYNVYYNFWNSQPNGTNFYFAIGSNIWEIKKTSNMPSPGQSCAYYANWFSLSARFSTNGGVSWNNYTMYDYDGTSHICTNQTSHGWSQYMTYGWGCPTNPTRAFGGGSMCDAAGGTIWSNWSVKLFY